MRCAANEPAASRSRRRPARAQAVAAAVVRTFTDYERDAAAFRAVRILLLEAFE